MNIIPNCISDSCSSRARSLPSRSFETASKYPQLFCSAARGGAGHATEKRISEENGRENENLVFTPGYNTWDLARKYAKNPNPKLRVLIHVGTKGFNYENNLEYMNFLESLKIPFERLIVPNVPHSASRIYVERGLDLIKFHAANFQNGPTIKN